MKTRFSAMLIGAIWMLVLILQSALAVGDELTIEEQRTIAQMEESLNTLLGVALEEVENKAKQGGKDAPKLLKEESKPDLGYYVYSEGQQRSYFHNGLMIRLDKVVGREMKDALQKKYGPPKKGARFDGIERLEKGDEVYYWGFQTIIPQGEVLIPFEYVTQFTIRKNGSVTMSLIDTTGMEAFCKASAKK